MYADEHALGTRFKCVISWIIFQDPTSQGIKYQLLNLVSGMIPKPWTVTSYFMEAIN